MKKIISIAIVLAMLSALLAAFAITSEAAEASVWDGVTPRNEDGYTLSGSGTETDPYLIQSANDLAFMLRCTNNGVNYPAGTYFKLTTDIVVNEDHANYKNWVSAAPAKQLPAGAKGGSSFKGVLDGDGHVIYGAYYTDSDTTGWSQTKFTAGFFGWLQGTVKNLGFVHCVSVHNGEGAIGAGIIAAKLGQKGNNDPAVIDNCYVSDSYVAAFRCAGLLAGTAENAKVTNCYTTGVVGGGRNGETDNGGLIGYCRQQKVVVKDVYSLATFSLAEGASVIGSLIGNCDNEEIEVSNAYYDSTVSGNTKGIGYAKAADKQTSTDKNGITLTVADAGFSASVWKDGAKGPVLKKFGSSGSNTPVPRSVSVWDGVTPRNEDGYTLSGSGTEADPYLIKNANDLAFMLRCTNNGVNYPAGTYFKLTTDIVVNEDHANYKNWVSAAPAKQLPAGAKGGSSFKGILDGNGHIIYGAYYSDNDTTGWSQTKFTAGFFGWLQGTVKNLGFVHCVSVHSGEGAIGAGIIAAKLGQKGNNDPAVIENCYVSDSYVAAFRCAGLLAGMAENARVTNCYTTGVVGGGRNGETDNGGLIGYCRQQKVVVKNVYSLATFDLAEGSSVVGSLIGNCDMEEIEVSNAYYDSTVSGNAKGIGYAKSADNQKATDKNGVTLTVADAGFDSKLWKDSKNGPVLKMFSTATYTADYTIAVIAVVIAAAAGIVLTKKKH